jgi:ArsR family transcriptional regulator
VTLATVFEEQARVFKAFCDDNRLRILELLRSGEKMRLCSDKKLDIGQSALSYHMKYLSTRAVVESRRKASGLTTKSAKRQPARLGLLKELTTPNSVVEDSCCCEG